MARICIIIKPMLGKRAVAALVLLLLAVLGRASARPLLQGADVAAGSSELLGKVDLLLNGTETVSGEDTVVWIPGAPSSGGSAVPSLASKDKQFVPHVLAVAKGASVAFPNADRVYHNVFSLSPGNAFDLGLYRRGQGKTNRFVVPGLVRIYCNIHPEMAAYVMVLDHAAQAVTKSDGTYRLTGLPAGRWPVHFWNERGGEKEEVVDLGAGQPQTLNVVLDAAAYKKQTHKNKYGREYPPVTQDVNRY